MIWILLFQYHTHAADKPLQKNVPCDLSSQSTWAS